MKHKIDQILNFSLVRATAIHVMTTINLRVTILFSQLFRKVQTLHFSIRIRIQIGATKSVGDSPWLGLLPSTSEF